ncbi:MAG: DUF1499 domain-containing protein [Pseudomonadota bacterium]
MKYALSGIVVLLVLGVGAFAYLGEQSRQGTAPGLVNGQLAPCPSSPNCVSSEAGTPEDKRVDPLPADSWTKLPAMIESMGGTVTQQSDSYIAAQFTSDTFGFVDDVEFQRTPDAVEVRSGSRVGYSDAGVNRDRINAMREKLGG